MRFCFTNDWLRRKIASDPDFGPEAGDPFGERVRPFEVSYFDEAKGERVLHAKVATIDEARGHAIALENAGRPFVWITDILARR